MAAGMRRATEDHLRRAAARAISRGTTRGRDGMRISGGGDRAGDPRFGKTAGLSTRLMLLALDQPMDRVEMLLRLALAAQGFVELGGVAMRLNRGGIAIERAQETAERRLVLLALAVQQSEPQMDLGAGRDDRGGTEQMA